MTRYYWGQVGVEGGHMHVAGHETNMHVTELCIHSEGSATKKNLVHLLKNPKNPVENPIIQQKIQ